MAVLVDIKERLKLTLLTLDYCGKQEVYAGQEFPTGTVACDVLNMPREIVNQVVALTDPMMKFVDALYHDRVDLLLMEQSRKNVFAVVELLKNVPPFSYQEYEWLDQKLASIFSPEAAKKAARQMKKPNDFCNLFVQSLCLAAQLGFAIQRYQQALIPLVESLDDTELTRDAEGYAKQFAKFFTADDYAEGKWMSLANVSVQYLASETGLTRRMHYASFPSMFRANLFEALCVGHAPKKCPICGKFFLTTNARQQKYCNGLAPEDTFGRTCRQVGARLGREARELAADDPRKIKCKQAIDAIDQRLHRGTISQELAERMKELARNYRDRAIMDSGYANGKYLDDMELTALETEASK